MTRPLSRRTAVGMTGLALAALAWTITTTDAPARPAQNSNRYRVTVTNVTRGQIFSPALVVSHNENASFFSLGAPASMGLQLLAEEGDNSTLSAMMMQNPDALDVRSDTGPVMPGASTEILVVARPGMDLISVAGMLVSTNDAFYAVRAVKAPTDSVTVFARAYDSGTEANSEDCAFIPGPPCGSMGAHDPATAEGYVHVHAGVHGIGGLTPADHDWRDVVAEIRIERVAP